MWALASLELKEVAKVWFYWAWDEEGTCQLFMSPDKGV
jgi:hypothetical protein